MIILIDTREQLPLDFNHDFITENRKTKLEVGDYGVEYKNGWQPPVVFERKGIGDLWGTLGKGYARFKREIELAQELNIKLILIIEGTLTKILKGYEQSEIKGITVVKKLFTLWIRYGLTPVFCKDREECSAFITEYYLALGRNIIHKKVVSK